MRLLTVYYKKHLSFGALRKTVSGRVTDIADKRQDGKTDYTIHDSCLSAFAMMVFQDPSLLAFQKRLELGQNKNNLKTLFNVSKIPQSTQLRDILDNVAPSDLEPLFKDFFRPLQRGKHLDLFRFLDDRYLITIDGSQYFHSENISCPQCLRKKSKDGTISYYHQVMAAALACPGMRQIIPMAPEPIENTDGETKQDCEINAAKRLVRKIRHDHPKLKIVITADSLHSKQPMVDVLKLHGMSFILVAKPSDHKTIYQWFSDFKAMGEIQRIECQDLKKRTHVYEWYNGLPLNDTKNADEVNYVEYTIVGKDGRINYHNSWVTDIVISKSNVENIVKGGRARWKIENEAFNTLKNQGYHLEHNFGHGQKALSYNLLLFNFLAFFMHQIFELTDTLYQRCRQTFTSRKEYWNQLRCTIRLHVFPSWQSLLNFILDPEQGLPPP